MFFSSLNILLTFQGKIMNVQKTLFIPIFLFLTVGWFTIGCGEKKLKTEYITGAVMMNGSPVAGATVTFSPLDRSKGYPATGVTDSNGKYTLQTMAGAVDAGTTPGEYKVLITQTENVETGRTSKVNVGNKVEEVKEMRSKNKLPTKYASISSTPLKATVVSGSNKFDFEIIP
jgi:hypothetical protein